MKNKRTPILCAVALLSTLMISPVYATEGNENTTIEVDGTDTTENSQILVYTVNPIVEFYFDGGLYRYEKIPTGTPVGEAIPPERDGYRFIGWFNPETGERWDFSLPITRTLKLEARYEPIPGKVDTADQFDFVYYAELLAVSVLIAIALFEGRNVFSSDKYK